MFKSSQLYNHILGQKTKLIIAISDDVFAIAVTLLILHAKVPLSKSINSERQIWQSFCTLSPKLLVCFLSFMTLRIFWTGHASDKSTINRYTTNYA